MTVNAIIQARCGSTRFPNKIFANINGRPLIWHVVNRLTYAKKIDDVIVATTTNINDDKIEQWCQQERLKCFRGSENNVLNRYYNASVTFPSDVIVRITADDPFKEPHIIDRVVLKLLNGNYDLVTNNFPPSFPEGLDCEAFTFNLLEMMERKVHDSFEREHVTQYAYHNSDTVRIGNVVSDQQLSFYRWTIDTPKDYDMVNEIYAKRKKDAKGILLMEEILNILKENPEIVKINSNVLRSKMYQ